MSETPSLDEAAYQKQFGGQQIRSTGLNADYINAWFAAICDLRSQEDGVIPCDREIKVLTYQQYMRENSLHFFDAMMADAKPEALAALDTEVDQYNGFTTEMRVARFAEFSTRIRGIIWGETN